MRLISCAKLTRYRVRSRSSRVGCGGTKLPRSKPCCSKSAIHSLSFWSVFRPGTALMCCAFTNNTLNCSARMRSEEHTSELQSHSDLVCRLLLEKKKKNKKHIKS